MNTYLEKLLLASHRLENHSIDKLTDIELYNSRKTKCNIHLNHVDTKEYSNPTCYIETTDYQATLLFIENSIDTEDGILAHYTKEIFQYSDRNTILHTYKNGAYIELNDHKLIDVSKLNNMQGEFIRSDIECGNLEELMSCIFQKMNHIQYSNKFDYLDDYNIHYSTIASHLVKRLKLEPKIHMEDINKILSQRTDIEKEEKYDNRRCTGAYTYGRK